MKRAVVLCVLAAIAAACSPGDQDRPDAIDDRDVPFQLLETTSTTTDEPASPTASPLILYFVDDDRLIPIQRLDPDRPDAEALLAALLDGPTADEAAFGVTSAVPSGTRASRVKLRANGTLVIELASDLEATDNTSALAVGQLVLTVSGAPGVERVRFEIDGKPVQVPKGDGTLADGPVTAADYRELQ